MPAAQSKAEVTWEGNLFAGSGRVMVESGVIGEQPISWASRTNRVKGKTSPEELIAAAHAGCYAMALSNTLDKAGKPPTRLDVSAVCSFEQVGGGFKITTMDLEVRGVVPGLDQAGFQELAQQGEQGCPVSNALRGNVDIRVKAQLVNG
ncbi:MAG TPA: OsmC family protein [Chloroflexota bacterium]|nr:OsmC family protein [Chloroflexota bacterium]